MGTTSWRDLALVVLSVGGVCKKYYFKTYLEKYVLMFIQENKVGTIP